MGWREEREGERMDRRVGERMGWEDVSYNEICRCGQGCMSSFRATSQCIQWTQCFCTDVRTHHTHKYTTVEQAHIKMSREDRYTCKSEREILSH